MSDTYAFDFETTHLDPMQGRIISVAIFGPGIDVGYINRRDEAAVLDEFAAILDDLPANTRLTTWNGWGFDLNWHRRRHAVVNRNAPSPLRYRLTKETSKYGDPLTRATWRGTDIGDVYYQTCWPTWARRQGLASTGLKAVAEAALGVTTHNLDPAQLETYTDEQILAYNQDDARWTWFLDHSRDLAAA